MKLLLTSAGITNASIEKAFFNLVDKQPGDIKLAFIPTPANAEEGNKATWLFQQYEQLRAMGIQWIDLVDFTAADIDWRNRLDICDVLYITGGNTFYLLDQIRKQGFDKYLAEKIESKVYVGGSASSITMTPTIEVAAIPPGDPNIPNLKDFTGLNYVDFEIEPHCDETRFEAVGQYAQQNGRKIYAIDDSTAIQWVDGETVVVSEGNWRLFDEKGK